MHESTTGILDGDLLRDALFAVFSTFADDVGSNESDQAPAIFLAKEHNMVDTSQRRDQFRTLSLAYQGAAGSFEFADALITVNADHEQVSQAAGLFEAAQMPDMK